MKTIPLFPLIATGVFRIAILLLVICPKPATAQDVSVKRWGTLSDGSPVRLFTLRNNRGVTVKLSDYGALLVSVEAPDRNRQSANVTLSYTSVEEAEKGGVFGSIIGRYANRIDNGGFSIEGVRYDLQSVNEKTNIQIHGGKTGFHRQLWKGATGSNRDGNFVRFTLQSPDGHEGFPGHLSVSVTYTLTRKNILRLVYEAVTDKPTFVNLTNHVYFNLQGSGDVRSQLLQLKNIQSYLETDDRQIPTGKLLPVAGTPFDFTQKHPIGKDIEKIPNGGYDDCFAIDHQSNPGELPDLVPFAMLSDPKSGRTLKIATTMPGVQIYTGNHLSGNPFPKWGGICFETEYYPDTPNKGNFPDCLLSPDQKYLHITDFEFGVEQESE